MVNGGSLMVGATYNLHTALQPSSPHCVYYWLLATAPYTVGSEDRHWPKHVCRGHIVNAGRKVLLSVLSAGSQVTNSQGSGRALA